MPRKRKPEELPQPRTNMWDLTAWYLRFLRNQREISGTQLGHVMGASTTEVSRIETGQVRLDGKRAALIDRRWKTGGILGHLVWYASLGHDPEWFSQYKELEQRARFIRTFEAQVIPGLLQIEAYARALISGVPTPDLDTRLVRRMERQGIFTADPAPQLGVVVSQHALEWPVGSPEIMRAQLAALLEASERHSVRVVPKTFGTGAYPGLDGSFTLMSGDDYGEVAYTESPEGGRLVSSPPDVMLFAVRYDRICGKALPEGPSRDLIRKVMEEFNEH
ncbi:helix-turn-helix domain-containing protein [Actinomadura sp. 9N215]|uniref:helix-turn-helix domain-containing protein n=1 Tax=Actinomadura sp. 9N215 TaxID=3375150 RepID=UPI00378DF575